MAHNILRDQCIRTSASVNFISSCGPESSRTCSMQISGLGGPRHQVKCLEGS